MIYYKRPNAMNASNVCQQLQLVVFIAISTSQLNADKSYKQSGHCLTTRKCTLILKILIRILCESCTYSRVKVASIETTASN